MNKVEKYKSFEEMKASAKPIDSANATIAMERHQIMKDFFEFLRAEHLRKKRTPIKKSDPQS